MCPVEPACHERRLHWRQVGADEEFDWAARYEPQLRALPLAAGGLGIAGVLLNRLFSGVRCPGTI